MAERVISYEFRARFDSFRAQLAAGGKSVDDFGKKLTALDRNGSQMRQGMTAVGDSAGKVGLVAAGGLAVAAKAAIDWESQWAGVMKTVDGSATQLGALEGELRRLAQTMPASHGEIAAVAEAAGQLGVARDDIADFSVTMIQLGETTNLSADQAATSIAQMANVMGTAPGDVERLGAALVALGNDGASTEAQILDMAQRIAGAGAQIGLAESEVLAIANAAASMGIEAEAGGTAISKVFSDMAKASAQGGEKLERFAQVAGMSASDFARAFSESPSQAFAAFAGGLDRINKSGGDVFTTLDQLKLSDVRVSQALLSMAASGDLLTDSLDLGAEAWDENSALADEFAKRLDTTAAEVQIAWNNIKDAAIDAGAVMLPVISTAAGAVSGLSQAFGDMPGPLQSTVTGMLAVTAVTGGTLWFGAKVVGGVVATNEALRNLGFTTQITAGGLAKTAKGLGAVGLAIATIDFGADFFDSIGRSKGALDGTAESVDELAEKLAKSNVGKFAFDLGIDIEKLATDLVQYGESGSYASRVIEELSSGTDSFGGAINGLTDFLAPWKGDTEKLGAANLDLGLILKDNEKLLGSGAAAADGASEAQNGFSAALTGVTESVGQSLEELQAQKEVMEDARKAATDTAHGFFNLGDSLNDAKTSMGGWIREMEAQGQALRDFRINAEEAGEKGVRQGLINALQEAGPEGALRMKQLAGATEAEIARANRAWGRGQREIQKYVDMKVPDKTIDVNPNPALNAIGQVREDLANLSDRQLTVWVTEKHRDAAAVSRGPGVVGGSPKRPNERAAGGPVAAAGIPQQIPIHLEAA